MTTERVGPDPACQPDDNQPPLRTHQEAREQGMLVVAAGELDMSTAPELNEQLDAALQAVVAPASLILDLRSVTFLGSIGLALLIEYTQRGAEQATPLRVVADHRPVLRGIEATGLTEALNIYPDLDQACRASDG